MMKEYLYSAPNEKYLEHIKLCLKRFEAVFPLFRTTIKRILNCNDIEESFRKMILYHDLGKLTEKWQENLNERKKLPSHASLGAAYLWKTLPVPDELKGPICFAMAIHHTDRGLLGDNIEKPDVQAITDGISDYSGKIKWLDKSKREILSEEFFPTELEELSVNDLKEMARELRKWAKGCSLLDQHKRRLQASLCHHILKLCDISAAANRKKWEDEDIDEGDLYGGRLMVKDMKDYIENIIIRQRTIKLQSELSRCMNILEKNYKPEKILIFGSMANNKINEWSDIDIVIVKETDKSFLDRIKEVILLVRPEVGMDILVYKPEEFDQLCNRNFFKKEILTRGKIIYERGS